MTVPPVEYIVGGSGAPIASGAPIEMKVGVDTGSDLVNVFDVRVPIPTGLDMVSWNVNESVVNLWIREPSFDQETRVLSLIGGVPGGFHGRALLINLMLQSREAGTFTVRIDEHSTAYLNDGLGTPAAVSFTGAEVRVVPALRAHPAGSWVGGLFGVAVIVGVVALMLRRRRSMGGAGSDV